MKNAILAVLALAASSCTIPLLRTSPALAGATVAIVAEEHQPFGEGNRVYVTLYDRCERREILPTFVSNGYSVFVGLRPGGYLLWRARENQLGGPFFRPVGAEFFAVGERGKPTDGGRPAYPYGAAGRVLVVRDLPGVEAFHLKLEARIMSAPAVDVVASTEEDLATLRQVFGGALVQDALHEARPVETSGPSILR